MRRIKIKSRIKNSFSRVSLITGILMVFLAWVVYKFIDNPFIYQSFEEILGFGLILIIAGIVFILFGKRIN